MYKRWNVTMGRRQRKRWKNGVMGSTVMFSDHSNKRQIYCTVFSTYHQKRHSTHSVPPYEYFGHVICQLIFNSMTTLYSQRQMSCVAAKKIRSIVWFMSMHLFTFYHMQMTAMGHLTVPVMIFFFLIKTCLVLHHRPNNYTDLCW